MNKPNLKTILRPILLASLIFPCSVIYADGMQASMDNIYNQMSNYTPPGGFETAQGHGYYGGRFTAKSMTIDPTWLSVTMPSASGGCGGIDAYAGSLSFINSERLIELFRAIAQQAPAYAFQLAIEAACPTCAEKMNDLQQKIAALNEYMGNSCQLAQGLITTTNPWGEASGTERINQVAEQGTTLSGLFGDVFEASTAVYNAIGEERNANPTDFAARYHGSLVYRGLKASNFSSWMAATDDSIYELIISLSGSPVIPATIDDDEGKTTLDMRTLPPLNISLKDIVEGTDTNKLIVYDCSADTDTCNITPDATHEIDHEPLKAKIADAFERAFTALQADPGNPILNQADQSVMLAMGGEHFSKMTDLLEIEGDGVEAARKYYEFLQDSFAAKMTGEAILSILRASRVAVVDRKESEGRTASIEAIDISIERIESQLAELAPRYSDSEQEARAFAETALNGTSIGGGQTP
ncbi:conjugal transfer protein TraH [uncultured Umboniibacter sp.]|uniref:conjugal transfer protein TraH n=1 Tax=uncultured Umboniibacter sp. TaxID=1798917 RepID=UPI00260FD36F|nr:conjugal transfer protein TraH [uncultured Umboniibacter sp.]